MAKQEVEVKVIVDGEAKGTEKFWVCSKADLGDNPKNIILEGTIIYDYRSLYDGKVLYKSLKMYLDDMSKWFEEHLYELHSMEIMYLVKYEDDTILY